MTDEFIRYSCQMALPQFGKAAQEKLSEASVLIVGAGGLGCPSALYLAASGIGHIYIADDDVISESNLHRQILYNSSEVGLKKATIAAIKLQEQNKHITVTAIEQRIDSQNILPLLAACDIAIDCTDNLETKYLLNDACVLAKKPLVYGAIYQYEGQVAVWNVMNDDGSFSTNYRDIFPDADAAVIPNCAEGGVLPSLAGIIGCMQANEVIKYITCAGELLKSKILMFDAQTMQSRIIKTGAATKTNITQLPESLAVATISAHALQQVLSKDEYQLIDVRNDDERSEFHIGGIHIPLHLLGEQMPALLNGKPVVFYCAIGKRSTEAVKIFKKMSGLSPAFSLEGGIKKWKEVMNNKKIFFV